MGIPVDLYRDFLCIYIKSLMTDVIFLFGCNFVDSVYHNAFYSDFDIIYLYRILSSSNAIVASHIEPRNVHQPVDLLQYFLICCSF